MKALLLLRLIISKDEGRNRYDLDSQINQLILLIKTKRKFCR